MAANFLRTCALTLTGASSRTINGGGSTDLDIVFDIKATTLQAPNAASFRVFNPSQDTVAAFKNKEFKTVQFSAGYEGRSGSIYTGDIMQSRAGKEDAVNGYLDVFCADAGNAYQQARVTKTLAAGYTPRDRLQVALDALAPFGISLRTVNVDLSTPKYPRGAAIAGMARDVARSVALSAGGVWSMHNGASLDIIDHTKPTSGPVVWKLNSASGMIGIPDQTENGVLARSLLNPAWGVNDLVQVDKADINTAERDNSYLNGGQDIGERNFDLANTGVIAADGMYRILALSRHGQTRGGDWYDDLTLIAVKGASPNQAQVDAGQHVTLGQL